LTEFVLKGCITAIITPFRQDGSLDLDGYARLVDFQLREGVDGIVVAGTTGEGPTIDHEEWRRLILKTLDMVGDRAVVIANTGTNDTKKTLEMTGEATRMGCKNVLMVDPYYNCPSSLEIREEYYEPVASEYPSISIIPYVIPGRTGTQISAHDLSVLYSKHPNISVVKDATGSDSFARDVRSLCGESYSILSGDDDRTFAMMVDSGIRANGVISVMSNIAPRAVREMVHAAAQGDFQKARKLEHILKPLFQVVTVKTAGQGQTEFPIKFRNPVPVKTIARILGLPAGPCRRPLGRLNREGLGIVREAISKVWAENPEVLKPIEDSFDVSIEERISCDKTVEGLIYV
jgi:4-hydroxy-tetrahydrodipicolinate synthase